jgi:hypothetical protein
LMRAIAISWLVEVACEFRFHQETLHMAASLLDRFLSKSKVLMLLCKSPSERYVQHCIHPQNIFRPLCPRSP